MAESTMVRIPLPAYRLLKTTAKREQRSMISVLDRAVRAYAKPVPMKLEPGTPDPRD